MSASSMTTFSKFYTSGGGGGFPDDQWISILPSFFVVETTTPSPTKVQLIVLAAVTLQQFAAYHKCLQNGNIFITMR